MSSYISLHARLYDQLYRDKNYRQESAFVHRALKKHGAKKNSSILEIACGTGTHSFFLEKLGYQITAVDNSKPMLKIAMGKALVNRSNIRFRAGDMRKLSTFREKFDNAICLFDSIGYALTNESIVDTLKGIHKNLKQDGTFIFEFWHAAAMIKNYEEKRIRKFTVGEKKYIRVSETRLDYANQTGIVRYTIAPEKKTGKEQAVSEIQKNRFFSVQEMKLFLSIAGFRPLHFYAGFTRNKHIDSNTWHIVAIAKKQEHK